MKRTTKRRTESLVDATGKKVAVVLDLQTYQNLLEAAEVGDDISAYLSAKPKVDREIAAGNYRILAEYTGKSHA
jgi:hypothetical protein